MLTGIACPEREVACRCGGGILRASGRVAVGAMLWLCAFASARAEMLHVKYSVSLVGLPIGVANLEANLTQSSYTVDAHAKITGLAYLFSRARGASTARAQSSTIASFPPPSRQSPPTRA